MINSLESVSANYIEIRDNDIVHDTQEKPSACQERTRADYGEAESVALLEQAGQLANVWGHEEAIR